VSAKVRREKKTIQLHVKIHFLFDKYIRYFFIIYPSCFRIAGRGLSVLNFFRERMAKKKKKKPGKSIIEEKNLS
jgi:hypothetical protein